MNWPLVRNRATAGSNARKQADHPLSPALGRSATPAVVSTTAGRLSPLASDSSLGPTIVSRPVDRDAGSI